MSSRFIRSMLVGLLVIAVTPSSYADASESASTSQITVYTAKKIITMDSTQPTATAVAVRGKRILSVGNLADLQPWLDAYPHKIDKQFEDKVLIPGFD